MHPTPDRLAARRSGLGVWACSPPLVRVSHSVDNAFSPQDVTLAGPPWRGNTGVHTFVHYLYIRIQLHLLLQHNEAPKCMQAYQFGNRKIRCSETASFEGF
jgi:hypothetical protein